MSVYELFEFPSYFALASPKKDESVKLAKSSITQLRFFPVGCAEIVYAGAL